MMIRLLNIFFASLDDDEGQHDKTNPNTEYTKVEYRYTKPSAWYIIYCHHGIVQKKQSKKEQCP
ncbi:hypothetical protein MM214_15535 [Belliella kenyensis]|nr:hypothetical protein [Belliella kenyensis]